MSAAAVPARSLPALQQRLATDTELQMAMLQDWATTFKPRDRAPFLKALPTPQLPPGMGGAAGMPPGAGMPPVPGPPGMGAPGPGNAPSFGGDALVQQLLGTIQ